MEVFTKSAQETKNLGEKISTNLSKKGRGVTATVIALSGELGSGKTTFIQGLAKGLGIPHRILSPTFIVSREYQLVGKYFDKFIHIDLYRIDNKLDLAGFGFDDIFANSVNLVAIEWAERLENKLTQATYVTFQALSENKRRIIISGADLGFKINEL